uniref:Uncharacterized protein n=1 Tax=Trypanosoma vivax (strain Y486) TaxID=1055687 RepID=G0U0C8_TRYVY|nr:hypothetical protein TVY486_0801340 [Trypanosoma vivax Y486]
MCGPVRRAFAGLFVAAAVHTRFFPLQKLWDYAFLKKKFDISPSFSVVTTSPRFCHYLTHSLFLSPFFVYLNVIFFRLCYIFCYIYFIKLFFFITYILFFFPLFFFAKYFSCSINFSFSFLLIIFLHFCSSLL